MVPAWLAVPVVHVDHLVAVVRVDQGEVLVVMALAVQGRQVDPLDQVREMVRVKFVDPVSGRGTAAAVSAVVPLAAGAAAGVALADAPDR